jgi:hypothetical protein
LKIEIKLKKAEGLQWPSLEQKAGVAIIPNKIQDVNNRKYFNA